MIKILTRYLQYHWVRPYHAWAALNLVGNIYQDPNPTWVNIASKYGQDIVNIVHLINVFDGVERQMLKSKVDEIGLKPQPVEPVTIPNRWNDWQNVLDLFQGEAPSPLADQVYAKFAPPLTHMPSNHSCTQVFDQEIIPLVRSQINHLPGNWTFFPMLKNGLPCVTIGRSDPLPPEFKLQLPEGWLQDVGVMKYWGGLGGAKDSVDEDVL